MSKGMKITSIELKKVYIPLNTATIAKISGIKYVQWGTDNKYPLFLNYLYNNCSIHRALIDGKVEYYKALLSKVPENINQNGDSQYTIDEIIELCLKDYELKNAFAIIVRTNEFTKSKVFDYVNIDHIRVSETGEFIYVCRDWDAGSKAEVEVYDNYFLNKASSNAIALYIGDVKDSFDPIKREIIKSYYPTPTYASAVNVILSDIYISKYNLSEIVNGFKIGTVVSLNNGIPETEAEQELIKSNLRTALQDVDNYGGIAVLFSNSKDSAPEIIQIQGNDLVNRYSQLKDEILQRLIIAHNITNPLLVGVKTEGQLGGATELEVSKEIFEQKYIIPRLKTFIKFINQIIPDNGVNIVMNEKVERIWVDDDSDKIDKIFNTIKDYGTDVSKIRLMQDIQEFDLPEYTLYSKYQQFDLKLTKLQDQVLQLLIQGEDLTSISKALSVDITEIARIYKELQTLKLVDEGNKVTKVGKTIAKQTEVIQVFYKYIARPGLGDDIIPTTREFCRKMVEHTRQRMLTREDITMLSSKLGVDLWHYRGGWYHDPRDGKNYPFCRHYWYQQVGIVKK